MYADKGSSAWGRHREVTPGGGGLAFGILVIGGLVFGIARANSREREVERQRRERLERLGRPGSAALADPVGRSALPVVLEAPGLPSGSAESVELVSPGRCIERAPMGLG